MKVEIPDLEKKLRKMAREGISLANTKKSFEKVAENLLREWKARAKNPKQRHATWFGREYAESLHIDKLKLSDLEVSIGPKTGKEGVANIIEEGRPQFDMRPSLLQSPKARMGKEGSYTIVSFQHGMEEVRRVGVEEDFKSMKTMTKTGKSAGLNAQGKVVSRAIYDYSSEGFGKRISSAQLETRVGEKSILGKIRRFLGMKPAKIKRDSEAERIRGMVKTREDVGLTFRIVKLDSEGWQFPKIEPENIQEEILDKLKNEYTQVMQQGFMRDIREAISK